MKICYNPHNIETKTVIALGNFDGVHLGHKAILNEATNLAKKYKVKSAVMTFEPHPLHLFKPNLLPLRINDLRTKLMLIEQMNIDYCYIMKFNKSFANISAQDFINQYLQNSYVVTGYNFLFGKNRQGNPEMLKTTLKENYVQVSKLAQNDVAYSSSLIREKIQNGNIEQANLLLGYNYIVQGKVIKGAGYGKKIGYPTANIKLKSYLLRPKYGVYKVNTNYGMAIANFGIRPTVDGTTELLEIHIFRCNQNLYGTNLKIEFLQFIRPEQKFSSVQELQNQIQEDIKKCNSSTYV